MEKNFLIVSHVALIFLMTCSIGFAADFNDANPAARTKVAITSNLGTTEATFDSELYHWLESIRNNSSSPGSLVLESSPPVLGAIDCSKFSSDIVLNIVNSKSCPFAKGLVATLKDTTNLCSRISDPLQTFTEVQPKVPSLNDTDDIEKLVMVSGVPLVYLGLKGAFASSVVKEWVENILRKIRFDKDTAEIAKRKNAIVALLKGFQESKQCALVIGTDREQAIEELSANLSSLETLSETMTFFGKQSLEVAKLDSQRVSQQGRVREDLPYQLLTDREREFTSMVISAMVWRMRGGGVYQKEKSWIPQQARWKYIRNPYNALARLNGGDRASGVGERLLLPLMIKGYSKYFDLGHLPGHKGDHGTQQEDFKSFTETGLYFVDTGAQYLSGKGFEVNELRFAGQQIASCYLHAWDVMFKEKVVWGKPPPQPAALDQGDLASGPLTWGELCYGAGLGLGLSRSLLKGYKTP